MAVAFDAVGPSSAGATGSATSLPVSTSWSHTCTGTNRAVVVAVVVGVPTGTDATTTVTVTFGGAPMTSLALRHSFDQNVGFVQIFGMANPPTGASTVVATASGSGATGTNVLATGSVSFTGVHQTAPFTGATTSIGNSATASITAVGTTDGIVVAAAAAGTALSAPTQTSRWLRNVNNGSGAGNGACSTVTGLVTSTTSYTVGSVDWWVMVAINVRVYEAPTPPPPPSYASVAWTGM